MKKLVLVSLIVAVTINSIFADVDGWNDYNVPVAVKNLMPGNASVQLQYMEHVKPTGGAYYSDQSGNYDLGTLASSKLTDAGKAYINTLTFGTWNGDTSYNRKAPYIDHFTINGNQTNSTSIPGTIASAQYGIAYSDVERKAYSHFVILPNGRIVQVAELIEKPDNPENGGIVLYDGSFIHPVRKYGYTKVTQEKSGVEITPPAGRPYPYITDAGTLGWSTTNLD